MQITILGKTIEVPDGDDRPREYKCPKCRDKEYIFYTDENGNLTGDSIDLSPCDYIVGDANIPKDIDIQEVEVIDYE